MIHTFTMENLFLPLNISCKMPKYFCFCLKRQCISSISNVLHEFIPVVLFSPNHHHFYSRKSRALSSPLFSLLFWKWKDLSQREPGMRVGELWSSLHKSNALPWFREYQGNAWHLFIWKLLPWPHFSRVDSVLIHLFIQLVFFINRVTCMCMLLTVQLYKTVLYELFQLLMCISC